MGVGGGGGYRNEMGGQMAKSSPWALSNRPIETLQIQKTRTKRTGRAGCGVRLDELAEQHTVEEELVAREG